jgi:hypothetical protein
MRASVQAIKPINFGHQFFEPEDMRRFFLFQVQNRFFTLGLEKTPLHVNAVWIFGPGAWSVDVKGELGYVRKAESTSPEVSAEEWLDLVAMKDGKTISMEIKRTPPIKGSALGDNNYVFPALMPALFVLEGDAAWDEVTIEGVLDKTWADGEMDKERKKFE